MIPWLQHNFIELYMALYSVPDKTLHSSGTTFLYLGLSVLENFKKLLQWKSQKINHDIYNARELLQYMHKKEHW